MSEVYEGVIRPPVRSALHAQLLHQQGGLPEDEYDDNFQNVKDPPLRLNRQLVVRMRHIHTDGPC